MNSKKKTIKNLLICFLIAFVFLTIASKNSWLYKMNDWYDEDCFMTMGKGILHGLVPYRDLFEQKGPILFFIFALANLISSKSFIGIYFIELISFTLFLFYVKKLSNLFYSEKHDFKALTILSFFIVILTPFGHGGSAEELCLPLFGYSLYTYFKYLKTGEISPKEILLNGMAAGIILWIKYTLLGFHFIMAASLFFINLGNKNMKEALKTSLIFLLGMFIITVPVITYFAFNNGLDKLIDVYFITNMTSYSKIVSPIIKLMTAFNLLFYNLIKHFSFVLFIVLPLLYFIYVKLPFKIKGSYLILLISLIFLGLGTFIGGTNYFYYSFVLTPFMVLGVLAIQDILEKIKAKSNIIRDTSLIILALTLLLITHYNIPYMFWEKEDYAQYSFAEIIKESDDKSLINYGFLDGGFYLTTETIPDCYFFMRNNLSYKNFPIMYDTQKSYVKENLPHYVITKKKYQFLANLHYKIIKEQTQKYETKMVTYYLYEREN